MEQNKIWMRYLQLGIIINLVILSIACSKKTEFSQEGDFYFVNETNYDITFGNGLEKFNVSPKSTTFVADMQDSDGSPTSASYQSPLMAISRGGLTIKFNADKCLVTDFYTEHSVLDIKNYLAEKLSKRKFKFTYTFTEADYNRATTCP